ncbi:SDR family oxidoreductase [Candidatus Roizmanbacteria bacterium]|nr:SDR family oxidoreductase [Candidatus Roizmanbacteria bacterium]
MKKVIVISGGTDGLGREIAKELALNNTVIILSPHQEKLEQTAQELSVDYEVCDVTNYEQGATAIQNIITKHSRIDVLINNAGIWIEGPLEANDPARIKQTLDVNTLGTIYLTKAVVPFMKQQQSGTILNVISQAGVNTKAEKAVYNASKWAITGFTKTLYNELAPYGIGVSGIYPGKMNTLLFEKAGIHKDMADALDIKNVAQTVAFMLSLPHTVFVDVGMLYSE